MTHQTLSWYLLMGFGFHLFEIFISFIIFHLCFLSFWNSKIKRDIHRLHVKVHLHEIFRSCFFFSSKAPSWSPDSYPRLFSNINSNSPKNTNLKVILRHYQNTQKEFV
jgi:hypothetical protein